MQKKRILFFMPDSPTRKNHGNRTHVMQMLEYFNSRADFFDLDYMAMKEWTSWTDEDEKSFHDSFPNFGLILGRKKMTKKNKVEYFFKFKLPNIIRKNKKPYSRNYIDDNTTLQLQNDFNNQLQRKQYDIIIISYVTWARLIDNNPYVKNAKLVIDTHDFMTAQFKERKGFELGKTFEREIQLLSLFDEVWSQSYDEKYLFSQFIKAKHRIIPIMYTENYDGAENRYKDAKYDIIYIGSDNENNQKSIKWFFDFVYPTLSPQLSICIIGLICNHIPDYPNVEKHIFISDLNEFYKNAKIAICPMLEGTGIKVKVVEAMSFGLPIVCTLRGIDGLPVKENSGCLSGNDVDEFAHQVNKLLTDEECYKETSGNAAKTFKSFFTTSQCYRYLDTIFEIHHA